MCFTNNIVKAERGHNNEFLMPAQPVFANSDVNASGPRLPLVAMRVFSMQASVVNRTDRGLRLAFRSVSIE
jgi:hypothetical protein